MVTLLETLLDKRELRGVNKAFAQKILDKHAKNMPEVVAAFTEDPARATKKQSYHKLKRAFRAELRDVYGVFFMPGYPAKRDVLAQALTNEPSREHATNILGLHRSTSERLPYYDFLYQQLFSFTGTPKSILDLGCGYNPFSYPFLNCTPAYHSVDIACDDLRYIKEFLEGLGTTHSEHCIDLTDTTALKKLPRADVAFAFKLFDTLETESRDVTKQVLDAIPAPYIITSFPTLSIGQHTPINPREWFERLVTEKVAGRVTLPNEQFVIITK